MKNIEIISIQNCIACDFVIKLIKELCGNRIQLNIITCNKDIANEKYKAYSFPTVIFKENMREIARIFGSMPKDFYKSVIDKFEEL